MTTVSVGDWRVRATGESFELESKGGKGWEREAGYDRLDEALEACIRRYVEERFRAAHPAINLDYEHVRDHSPRGTRLVFRRGQWRLETWSMGKSREHGSWRSIYAASLRARRGGVRHKGMAMVRQAVAETHLTARRVLCCFMSDSEGAWGVAPFEVEL